MTPELREARFFRFVTKTSDCWFWIGSISSTGYGDFRWGRSSRMKAHRFSWFVHTKKLPDKFVLHKCDNPICVNPDHLFIGNASDNSRDMVSKGRHASQMRTACPSGHPYISENTYIHKNRSRRCKTCASIYAKRKAAKNGNNE